MHLAAADLKSTSRRACTPGKLLAMPVMRRRGSPSIARAQACSLLQLTQPLGLVQIGIGDHDRCEQHEVALGLLLSVSRSTMICIALRLGRRGTARPCRKALRREPRQSLGSASKPMTLTLSAIPALHRLDRSQRHVVVGGDDHVGRAVMPASRLSVTERPSARPKFAVCSAKNLYLSAWASRTLCRPLLRSIAGEAPG